VSGKDTHVYILLEGMCRLLFSPQDWYFDMDEICAYCYICDFYRFDPFFFVLYGDVIIFARCIEKCMMWCLKIFSHEDDMKDIRVWHVVDGLWLCSFIFIGGQCSLEVRNVVIVSYFVGYNDTYKVYRIYISTQQKIMVS